MTNEEILSYPAKVLSQAQREFYLGNGYILLEEVVPVSVEIGWLG